MWSDSFTRALTNYLGLQRDLSIAVAEQIRLRLSPDVAAAIDRRQTQNPVAYDLYLKGRAEWMRLTPDSMRRALRYFEQAVAADESYALAWGGLAFAAITSLRTADRDPREMKPIALAALQRAEEIGPDLVETVYARGYYSLFGDLDSQASARAARAAIDIDPHNAQAHMLLGVSLMGTRTVEAREEMRRARELGPNFALAFANSANVALAADEPEEALEFAMQTVAMNEEFWLGYFYLGRALERLDDADGALEAYDKASRYSDGHSLTYSARVSFLVRLGRLDEARALVEELTRRAARTYVPPYTLAVLNAQVGETSVALAALDRAVEVRDVNLPALPTDPRLMSLHDDARFADLLARCGCLTEADSER